MFALGMMNGASFPEIASYEDSVETLLSKTVLKDRAKELAFAFGQFTRALELATDDLNVRLQAAGTTVDEALAVIADVAASGGKPDEAESS